MCEKEYTAITCAISDLIDTYDGVKEIAVADAPDRKTPTHTSFLSGYALGAIHAASKCYDIVAAHERTLSPRTFYTAE